VTIDANRPVAIVTGASAGIGLATARQLVEQGWQVIGVGRDPQRCAQATGEITAAVRDSGSFTMLRGDLGEMAEVKRVADEIAALTPRVDVLINNAGGMRDRQIITSEGLEATFTANHLAAFLLTRELKPLLDTAVARSEPGSVRVLAVSSNGHRMSQGLNWDDLQSMNDNAGVAYCQAKLANLLFTRELARRAASDGIIAQAMHPGVAATNFAEHGGEGTKAWYATVPDVVAPDVPAETLVWLATDPEGGREPGRYFYNKSEEAPADLALDDTAAQRLWSESEKLLASVGF
jgi:NAD(P)-dependent dehydrogenase (short-subunit alcohol dehydrogenase family)